MQSTLYGGFQQPLPQAPQADLSLDETILLLSGLDLGQILSLRESLPRFNVNEIANKFIELHPRRDSTQSRPPNPHWSYQSSVPSLRTDRGSFASSHNSYGPFTPNAANYNWPTSSIHNEPLTTFSPWEKFTGPLQVYGSHMHTPSAPNLISDASSPAQAPSSLSGPKITPIAPAIWTENNAANFHNSDLTNPPVTKDIPKPIPCSHKSCTTPFSGSSQLLEHTISLHDRDVEFICTHRGCGNIAYSDRMASRHHTNRHNSCPHNGVDCRTKRILRHKEYWGCDVCGRQIFSSGRQWADHYCDHFPKSSQSLANGGVGQPKDRVSITRRILSLLKQPATRRLWEECNRKLINDPADVLQHTWDESENDLSEFLSGLQYGTFRGGRMEQQEIAQQLVNELLDLSSIRCRPAGVEPWTALKRRASRLSPDFRLTHNHQSSSNPDRVQQSVASNKIPNPNILDSYDTVNGYFNRV